MVLIMSKLLCFKACDIRGRLPDELNESIAWRIGRATAEYLKPEVIVVGRDARLSSLSLKVALSDGLRSGGTDVIDIGLCGTEEIYFATSYLKTDGGIMVTASHNPKDYNGMKIVQKGSIPISSDTGFREIQRLAEDVFTHKTNNPLAGSYKEVNNLTPYLDHILEYINPLKIKPLKLVVNAGNGTAGKIIDAIEERFNRLEIPLEFIKVHHQPDGNFPHGIPNPLLKNCRQATTLAVLEHKADMGIAWDGDFDRCFLFDEKGQFIEGYYIVGLLGEAFLKHYPGARIIHDPRLTWNTIDQIKSAGGEPVLCRTGHAFIKERMRREDAVYGGEMSAHHYFRDFAYCDSGMIPWLLISELISRKNCSLSQLVGQRIAMFPSSGEVNCKQVDPEAAIKRVLSFYQSEAINIDFTDGISVEMKQWRFNLRKSNTEAFLRLNVESRGDRALVTSKAHELMALITAPI